MTGAWRMVARSHGGPEVIVREDFDPGAPGEGELLVAQDAVGLNFIDTYYRTGLYPAPLPTPEVSSELSGHGRRRPFGLVLLVPGPLQPGPERCRHFPKPQISQIEIMSIQNKLVLLVNGAE